MKLALGATLGAALLLAVHGAVEVAVEAANPVSKALTLLSSLEVQIIKEGQEAQKLYDEFATMCQKRARSLGFEIKKDKRGVRSDKATIGSSKAQISSLTAKIQAIVSSLSKDENNLKSATKIRTMEASDFKTAEQDLMQTVSTLGRAILMLENQKEKGGAAFVQFKTVGSSYVEALSALVDSSMIGIQDATKLTALVQSEESEREDEDEMSMRAPAASKYDSHSKGILSVMEDLLDKAKGALDGLRTKEQNAAHNYKMVKQSLEDEIKDLNKDMENTKLAMAERKGTKATAKGELTEDSKDLKLDDMSKKQLRIACTTKAKEFEANVKSRAEEVKALAMAAKVLKGSTGGATSQTYGLIQENDDDDDEDDDLAFLQAESTSSPKALLVIRKLAHRTRSIQMAQLAQRMAIVMRHTRAGARGPFGKVKGLLKGMVQKLQAEARAEGSHKRYCDHERSISDDRKAEKKSVVDKLKAKIDGMLSRSTTLKDQVVVLQKELSELASTRVEMTNIRNKEKTTFVKGKKEMQQGIAGVQTALSVLRDYYSQDKKKSHESGENSATGIVGLLEVVESDFTKGLAEMEASEDASAREYRKEMEANAIEKARKDATVTHKRKESKSLDVTLREAKMDRTSTQEQLNAILMYLSKLDKMCISKPQSHAERAAKREEEMAGLKEALNAISGEAFLQKQASLRGARLHLM